VRRFISYIILAAILAVTAAAVFMYLSYGTERAVPAEVRSLPVTAETTIRWHDNYTVIEAPDEPSTYAALGYAHATTQPWLMALMRQTGRGRLAAWYGSELATIDTLSLQLGLAESARAAFLALPDEERRPIEAYAAGVNHAFSRRDIRLQDEFTLLGVTPDRWEPWHSLVIERLFALLAVQVQSDTLSPGVAPELDDFHRRARALKRFLGIHDLDHSAAWHVTGDSPTTWVRLVYGSSVVPVVTEHRIERPEGSLSVAALIGTPFAFVAKTPDRVQILLPSSSARVTALQAGADTLRTVHARFEDTEGREALIESRRGNGMLSLGRQIRPVVVDSVVVREQEWVLNWPGIGGGSDAAAFRAMLRSEPASFRLFDNVMLNGSAEGATTTGPSDRTVSGDGATLVGHPRWAPHLYDRLVSLTSGLDSLGAASLFDDAVSTWAAEIAPPLIEDAGDRISVPPAVAEAMAYLRSWDFNYDDASIAASIFDRWLITYYEQTGRMPDAAPDTLFAERLRRYETLETTVNRLEETLGPDLVQWRWERTEPDIRYVPGFPGVAPFPRIANRRYAPIEITGRGHPSTLDFGKSPLDARDGGSASWEAWASFTGDSELHIRRRHIDVYTFRGRYMVPEREPDFFGMAAGAEPTAVTRLLP